MPDLLGVSVFVANHVTFVLMCQEIVKSGIFSQAIASEKHGTETQVIALDFILQAL